MSLCYLCNKQSDKSKYGAPHDYLEKIGEQRIFSRYQGSAYEEQDYQCLTCQSKFTHSTNKNDLAWTLWQA